MATKLRKLRIDEVSICDVGANPHARITLFKRATPTEIETPKDSAPLEFNASGRGPAHDALWIAFDNYRRQMGPAQGRKAFETAWADLDDDEKQEIRNEEAATEAAKEAAAAAAEKERQREMMKQLNSKLAAIVKLAHEVQDGKIGNHADRASWYSALKALAEEHREPGETAQMAFARTITKTVDGKAMFAAYQGSAGTDYVPPAPVVPVAKANPANEEVRKLASEMMGADPSMSRLDALVKIHAARPDLSAAARAA
jgi:hypothetical protein